MSMEIVLNNISKNYGNKKALSNVSLTIKQGMFGLLGRNGAGKTTLMKVLATLLQASEGNFTICNIPMKQSKEIRNIVGYLPQDFSMYKNMTVYEAMDYLGVLSGLEKKIRKDRIPFLLDKVNLGNNQRTKIKAMSGGMKRRLGIAQAILHDPKVLIVDEPTAGLDPEERVRFRNLLSEIAEDRIIILSTHIIGDIEATCEKLAIMDEGEIIYNGTVEKLLNDAFGKIFTAEISKTEFEELKAKYPITSMLSKGSTVNVRFVMTGDKKELFKEAIESEPTAEDAYMYLMYKERGLK